MYRSRKEPEPTEVVVLPPKDARAAAHRTRIDVLRIRLANYPKDANRAYNILCGKSMNLSQMEKHRDALNAKLQQRRAQFMILEDEMRVMSIEMLVTEIRIQEKITALQEKKAKTESIAELRLKQQREMEAFKMAQAMADPPQYSSMVSLTSLVVLFIISMMYCSCSLGGRGRPGRHQGRR